MQKSLDFFPAIEKKSFLGGELVLLTNFLSAQKANEMLQFLIENAHWQQSEIVVYGKKYLEPRLTAWYANPGLEYSYSKKRLIPEKWLTELINLKQDIEQTVPGKTFNSVLLNYYRDGNDKMGWHADNEKELGPNPCIASLSLGAARYFDLKHKTDPTKKLRLELTAGTLVIMSGTLQENWLHQIPQQKRIKEPRINLTFRRVISFV